MDEELYAKVSADMNELIKKSNAYQKEMQENTRRYREQRLKEELDSMEKDLKLGNTISAFAHQTAANGIQRILQSI